MRPEVIVFLPPALDKDLRFCPRIYAFPVEKLILELPDKGLDVAVLPRAPGFEIECGHAVGFDPAPNGVDCEFRTVARPNMLRESPC
jgi:hypothetical protein